MARDTEKARDQWDRYLYARDAGHSDFVKKAAQCEDYASGKQWDDLLKTKLERAGKPALTLNKTLAIVAAISGEQIDLRADVTFRSKSTGSEEVANALAKVWMHVAGTNSLEFVEADVFLQGIITSRGFFDVRMDFTDSMLGEVRIGRLNSKNVVIDPDGEDYDPDTWSELFITKWLSPNDIERIYGAAEAKDLLNRKPQDTFGYDSVDVPKNSFGKGSAAYWRWASLDPEQMKNRKYIRVIERQFKELKRVPHFVDMETGDTRPIPEGWDRERIQQVLAVSGTSVVKLPTERILWRVTAEDLVLFDEVSPYKHFTPVPYFPYLISGQTVGIGENLLSPQDLLNKVSSQELHVVNTTANSGWQMEEDQLVGMEPDELEARGAETGLVLVRRKGTAPLDKIQPNQVPTGLDRIGFKADEFMKDISGVSDSKRGFDRADVAAKAIQAKQAAGTVNLAMPLFNLNRTRKILARNVLDLIQTFYHEERILRVTKGGLIQETEEIAVNQVTPEGQIVNDLTVGEYDVVVSAVPTRETYEESQFQEALALRQLGVAIPDDVLVEHSHLNRKREIAERIKAANGGAEPTEAEQRMREAELALKELEAEEKKATVLKGQADAALSMVRAQKEAGQGGEAQLEAQVEMEKAAQEMAIKREKMLADVQLAREKLAAELELKREEMRQNMLLKRAEAAMRMKAQEEAMKNGQGPISQGGQGAKPSGGGVSGANS